MSQYSRFIPMCLSPRIQRYVQSLSQKFNSILIRLESENNICADIDECKDTSSCSNTENSICINSPGGFQCICRKGHVMYKEGLTCVV